MANLINAERRLRESIRAVCDGLEREDAKRQADQLAGDVAAQVYHYLVAVAHSELAVLRASKPA